MPATLNTALRSFQEGIRALHDKIALLPESQQPQLRKMVELANHECTALHHTCQELRDSVDDLHLATRYAEFDIEATGREIEAARRTYGLE